MRIQRTGQEPVSSLITDLRKSGSLASAIAMLVVFGYAAAASAVPAVAGPIPVNVTLEINLGSYPTQVATATGVAILSGAGPLGPNVLRLEGVPAVNTVVQVPFASFPTIGSRFGFFISNLGVNATLRAGTFAPVTGLQPLTQLRALGGRFTAPPFGSTYGINFVRMSAVTTFGPFSVGVGGADHIAINFTPIPLIAAGAAPWRIGAATLVTQTASSPAVFQTVMRTGFLHAPTSSSTNVIHYGGALQLITPTQISTDWIEAGTPTKLALFSTLTIQFIPEPEVLLTLSCGAVFLLLVGRKRIGKR